MSGIKATEPAADDPPPLAVTAPAGFFAKFAVLKGAERELWLTFVIKLLIIVAYSITNKTLILWLSSDLGYSDQLAGVIVGWVWAPAMTVFTLLAGSITDALGLRRTFFFGVFVCLFARAVMVVSTARWLSLAGGLAPLVIGEALGTPVLIAATRRYSTTRQRSIAFSLIYTIMNVGFLVAARIYDYMRQHLGEHGSFNLFGEQISTYRALFLVSFIFELSILIPIYFLRKGAEVGDDGMRFAIEPTGRSGANFGVRAFLTVRDSALETIRLFKRLLGQSGFYRLLAFLLLIGFLKVIVMQMDYVFPKFAIRELGDGAPVGQLLSINYLLIIFLVPTIGALTQRFSAYRMVIVGGAICAASVFIMALPTSWFMGAAEGAPGRWIGQVYLGVQGAVHPYYVMVALYMVLFSVGEAFYSPRVYEYAAAIAPKGQEASYGALSYIPFLLGKLLIGSAGWLLAIFCPAQGPRHSGTMWLIFALAASVAPVGLLLFRRNIRLAEAGREKGA